MRLPQQRRLAAAFVYLLAIGLLGTWALHWHFPPFGLRGLWFYSAGAALILGEFILEPFFTRPADAIANGATLLLTAASVSSQGATVTDNVVHYARLGFVTYALIVLCLGAAAITLKDARGRAALPGRYAYLVVGTLGRARWLFGALYFAAVYAAFSDSAGRVAILYLAWIIVFSAHPVERLLQTDQRRRMIGAASARVLAVEDPRIVLASVPGPREIHLGQRATVGGHEGRVVDVSALSVDPLIRIALTVPAPVGTGDEVVIEADIDATVVGHVSPGTTIDELVAQVPATDSTMALEEAQLVRALLRGREVLFQITAAAVEMRVDDGGARDMVSIRARKLGIWDDEHGGFAPVAWVPTPGDVVRTFAVQDVQFDPRCIGFVPGTRFGVEVDLDAAVTHNTAILGILGSGKTHVAWELMKRLLVHGVKVVALDITGRYTREFDDVSPNEYTRAFENRIEATIAPSRNSDDVQNNQAGNVRTFASALRAELRDWYDGDCPLLVLNPLNFDVTRMEGYSRFDRTAVTLTRLTMVEVTRLITEALLEIAIDADAAQPNPQEKARLCLVLEEAHSLVPEWNAATGDAEKWAVNGTARAVLQGRKYGFGCLLVTQRTASVTKSILNQCNTIFALRAYDATGAGFLENYIGAAYGAMLAALKIRQAVLFGRASSCGAPIAIQVNEAGAFNVGVWQPALSQLPRCEPPHADVDGVPAAPLDLPLNDDDIPF
jgi:hypothetical protein